MRRDARKMALGQAREFAEVVEAARRARGEEEVCEKREFARKASQPASVC